MLSAIAPALCDGIGTASQPWFDGRTAWMILVGALLVSGLAVFAAGVAATRRGRPIDVRLWRRMRGHGWRLPRRRPLAPSGVRAR